MCVFVCFLFINWYAYIRLIVCALQLYGVEIKIHQSVETVVRLFCSIWLRVFAQHMHHYKHHWHANVLVYVFVFVFVPVAVSVPVCVCVNVNVNDRRSFQSNYRQRKHENIERASTREMKRRPFKKRNNELYSIAHTTIQRTYVR